MRSNCLDNDVFVSSMFIYLQFYKHSKYIFSCVERTPSVFIYGNVVPNILMQIISMWHDHVVLIAMHLQRTHRISDILYGFGIRSILRPLIDSLQSFAAAPYVPWLNSLHIKMPLSVSTRYLLFGALLLEQDTSNNRINLILPPNHTIFM